MMRKRLLKITIAAALLGVLSGAFSGCHQEKRTSEREAMIAEVEAGGGLGPLTKAAVKWLWHQAFDSGGDFYLPKLIKDGSTSRSIPSYDPAKVHGQSSSMEVKIALKNRPFLDAACASPIKPPPIASGNPSLVLENVLIVGLHAISQPATSDHGLSFSSTQPEFTTEAAFGSLGGQELPLLVAPHDWDLDCVPDWKSCLGDWNQCLADHIKGCLAKTKSPTYEFVVGCCVPEKQDSRVCEQDSDWFASASGPFLAVISKADLTTVNKVTVGNDTKLQVTIESIVLKVVDSKDLRVQIDVAGKAPWIRQTAQIVVNQGTYSGSVTGALNSFLSSPGVRGDLSKALTEEVNKWPPS